MIKTWVIPFVAIIGAIVAVLVIRRQRQRQLSKEMPVYERRKSILSPVEQNFYTVLQRVVGDRARIFVKVRLVDLVAMPEITPDSNAHLRRASRRSIDFLLSSPTTLMPMVVIALDDRELRKKRGLKKDDVIPDVLAMAGLPLLTIRTKKSYDPAELSHKLRLAITRSSGAQDTQKLNWDGSEDEALPGTAHPTERLKRVAKKWVSDLKKSAPNYPRADH